MHRCMRLKIIKTAGVFTMKFLAFGVLIEPRSPTAPPISCIDQYSLCQRPASQAIFVHRYGAFVILEIGILPMFENEETFVDKN